MCFTDGRGGGGWTLVLILALDILLSSTISTSWPVLSLEQDTEPVVIGQISILARFGQIGIHVGRNDNFVGAMVPLMRSRPIGYWNCKAIALSACTVSNPSPPYLLAAPFAQKHRAAHQQFNSGLQQHKVYVGISTFEPNISGIGLFNHSELAILPTLRRWTSHGNF